MNEEASESEEATAQPEPSLVALRWGCNMDKRPNSRPVADPSLVVEG